MTNLVGQVDWSAIIRPLVEHGLRIFIILLLAFVLRRALKGLGGRITRAAVLRERRDVPEVEVTKRIGTLTRINSTMIDVAVILLAAFMVLSEIGIDVTALIAGAGVVGLAVGFGAQNLVRDIITGFFIILDNRYNKGDVVGIAGVWGFVEDMDLRRTVLRDLDGAVHTVPNGAISVASNLTREWSRVNLNVPVGYGEDLDRVTEVLNRVGKELAEDEHWGPLISDAPQVLRVDNFEESGIAIKMLGITQPLKQWDVMGELRRRIKKAFDDEGIEIPYPHRVVIQRGPAQTKD